MSVCGLDEGLEPGVGPEIWWRGGRGVSTVEEKKRDRKKQKRGEWGEKERETECTAHSSF